jgi:hypothetical protein
LTGFIAKGVRITTLCNQIRRLRRESALDRRKPLLKRTRKKTLRVRLKMFIYLLSKNYKSLILFRIVLQRQFFEALVRSASLKYANRADLSTLAEKVDALFKNKLLVHATKSKAKSVEEEVRSKIYSFVQKQYKVAEKLFEEYDE